MDMIIGVMREINAFTHVGLGITALLTCIPV